MSNYSGRESSSVTSHHKSDLSYYFCIPISPEYDPILFSRICNVYSNLREAAPGYESCFVPLYTLHVTLLHGTLKYGKEASQFEREAIQLGKKAVHYWMPEIQLTLEGLKHIGREEIYIPVVSEASSLQQLRSKMLAALEPYGFEVDRQQYEPHVTLARMDHSIRILEAGRFSEALLDEFSMERKEFRVKAIDFVRAEKRGGEEFGELLERFLFA